MYQPSLAAHALPASLAVTGVTLQWSYYIVGAATLVFFGMAMLRLVPRRES